MKKLIFSLTALTTLHAAGAHAAGYGLREFSIDAAGSAYAGATATGTDASYLAYNPASLGAVTSTDFALGAIVVLPDSDGSYTTALTSAGTPAGGDATPGDYVDNAVIPGLAARMRLSDRWAAGLVVYAPWGLSTNYDAAWAGRYYALKTKLLTVNITPSVSYEVAPGFTFAAGLQIQYAEGTLSNAVDIGTIGATFAIPGSIPGAMDGRARFDADSWDTGFTLGALWEAADNLTLGLSYRSAVHHSMDGSLDFTLDAAGIGAVINGATGLLADTPASAGLTTPEMASFGARVGLDAQWTALFELEWTNWSRFRELRVNSDNPVQPDDVTLANWDDSWFVALGAEYAPNDQWSFRAGAAYDETPVPDATRSPRIPDESRIWLSLGATYKATPSIDIKAVASHMFLPDASISLTAAEPANALRGNLAGSSEAGATVLGLQFVYRLS